MMRSLDNVLKIYYRLIAKQYKWGTKADAKLVNAAKLTAEKHIKKHCNGLKIDCVSPQGGTTNVGNTAMRFLSLENRKVIGMLIENAKHRCSFLKLLRYFKVF